MEEQSPAGCFLDERKRPDLPTRLARQPRIGLAALPTPIQETRRLTQALGGSRILIKRDDLTGLATGGNKVRKLEYLIADALTHEADCVITAGGPQSNHCLQTAAATARVGLDCHLVLGGEPPQDPRGNLLLDMVQGATIHWAPWARRPAAMEDLASSLHADGSTPYVIPIGGSNAVGAFGYVTAMFELRDQLSAASCRVDHIVFATASGGTQAGLALGAALTAFPGTVTGIGIERVDRDDVAETANSAAELLETSERIGSEDIRVVYDYLGGGYGVVGDLERDAVELLARTEGIHVGPVYTGRALGGLVDMVRDDRFGKDETVLFWHTGDQNAIHAYAHEFVGRTD
ncbi:MAG: D-cysteine desulfhydrase family protein [Candidatus Latescibacteria bacterium]|jgi:D-cysteine desulfhydrase|nr:D-cysteine desulfhydrase family protein [Candidatus Latescibacterota bacterium]